MSLQDELAEVVRAVIRSELERLPSGPGAAAGSFDPLEMLTPDNVATLFKLTPDTVRGYCAAGDLPGHKFGNVWRLRRSELLDWVERHGMPEGVPSPAAESERILRSLRSGA